MYDLRTGESPSVKDLVGQAVVQRTEEFPFHHVFLRRSNSFARIGRAYDHDTTSHCITYGFKVPLPLLMDLVTALELGDGNVSRQDHHIEMVAAALSRYLTALVGQPLLLLSAVIGRAGVNHNLAVYEFYLCSQIAPVSGVRLHDECPKVTSSGEDELHHAKVWLGCSDAPISWIYLLVRNHVDFDVFQFFESPTVKYVS